MKQHFRTALPNPSTSSDQNAPSFGPLDTVRYRRFRSAGPAPYRADPALDSRRGRGRSSPKLVGMSRGCFGSFRDLGFRGLGDGSGRGTARARFRRGVCAAVSLGDLLREESGRRISTRAVMVSGLFVDNAWKRSDPRRRNVARRWRTCRRSGLPWSALHQRQRNHRHRHVLRPSSSWPSPQSRAAPAPMPLHAHKSHLCRRGIHPLGACGSPRDPRPTFNELSQESRTLLVRCDDVSQYAYPVTRP
jgi:hypothetical protein